MTETSIEPVRRFILEKLVDAEVDDLAMDEQLLESGIIDSVSLVSLASFIEQEYGLELNHSHLDPQRFETLAAIQDTIDRVAREQEAHAGAR